MDADDHPKLPIPDNMRDMELYLFAFEAHVLGHRLLWASKGDHGASMSLFHHIAAHETDKKLSLSQLDSVLADLAYPLRRFPGRPRN